MFDLSEDNKERAERLHNESLVIDTAAHALYSGSILSKNMEERVSEFSKDTPASLVFAEMQRMENQELIDGKLEEYKELWQESSVDVASVSVGIHCDIIKDIANWTRRFDAVDWLVKTTSVEDIKQAKKQGKRAVILNSQFDVIGKDLDKLDLFYDFGLRIMGLAFDERNYICDGRTEITDSGVSRFGIEVVKRMNELGILIDLSHVGRNSILDVIEISMKPVAFTHTCCSKLYPIKRNATDEELEALAKNNGYCGIMVEPNFLAKEKPSLHHFLDHLQHAIEIMGIDKVGIGTDYGLHHRLLVPFMNSWIAASMPNIPDLDIDTVAVTEGWEEWGDWPNITSALVSRGYSDEEVKGILGGNFSRIFKEVVG